MKRLSKTRLISEDTEAFGSLLYSESDRAVIIMFASALEDFLDEMLLKKMPSLNSDERTELFGFEGPFGTFANKTRVAKALGIITRKIRDDLDVLREIRNQAAHAQVEISFATPAVKAAISALIPKGDIEFWRRLENEDTRDLYIALCGYIGSAITVENFSVPAYVRHVEQMWEKRPASREKQPRE